MSAGPVLAVVTPFPRTPLDDVDLPPLDLRTRMRSLESRLEAEGTAGLDVTQLAVQVATETVRATLASLERAGASAAPAPADPPSVRSRGPLAAAVEHVLSFLVVLAGLVLVLLVAGPVTGTYRTATMLTGSMSPALPRGAALIGVPVPISRLHPGDVVTFRAPIPGHPLVTHRLLAVVQHDGRPALRTKGDANAAPDPWLAVPGSSTVWVVKAGIPGLGQLLTDLRQPAALAAVAFGLLALLGGAVLLERRAGGPQAARP